MCWHDTLSALKLDIHPFSPLHSVTPNLSAKRPPPPNPGSSIIRPELIVMHFAAEVGKPYPWISTMYPPAHPHTSVPSPLPLHPWPQCVTFPAVSREARQSLLLHLHLHLQLHVPRSHRQLTDQIRDVPITILACWRYEKHPDSHIHSHAHLHTHTHTLTHAFRSQWAETESTWHTILVVYIAVNSSTETVWQAVHDH